LINPIAFWDLWKECYLTSVVGLTASNCPNEKLIHIIDERMILDNILKIAE